MGQYISRIDKEQQGNYGHEDSAISDPLIPHPKQSIVDQNALSSRLYRLPTELILEIESLLYEPTKAGCYASKMAFYATCRRFRQVIPKTSFPAGKWNDLNRVEYTRVLKLAQFKEICEMERDLLLCPNHLVCCICRSSHVRSCFTKGELTKAPEDRVCKGSEGVRGLCSHFGVTYTELQVRPIDIVCSQPHSFFSPEMGSIVKVSQVGKGKDTEVKASVEILLLELKGYKLTNEMILEAVKKTRWKLCPHMHASFFDPCNSWYFNPSRANGALLSLISPHSITCLYGRWCRGHSQKWPMYKCRAKECDTRFWVTRKKRRRKEYLVMEVKRYLR